MKKLTLDTNILRDWAWCEGLTGEKRYDNNPIKQQELSALFAKLRACRNAGIVEIGVTTQLYSDFDHTLAKLRPDIEAMIGPYVMIAAPAIVTFPLVFPIVFPEIAEAERLMKDVFPNSRQGQRNFENNKKDLLQLYAHMVASRDFFVSNDRNILVKASILAAHWNIRVTTLQDLLTTHIKAGPKYP